MKFIRVWVVYKPVNGEYPLCWDIIERLYPDDEIDDVLRYCRDLVADYFECSIISSNYKIVEFSK